MAKTLTIQLPDDIDRQLALRANQLNISPEVLILQALNLLLSPSPPQPPALQWSEQWSEVVLTFTGIPDLPPFEFDRISSLQVENWRQNQQTNQQTK